jgi:hypothetical protein
MSVWHLTYHVQIYQQLDNTYAAMASTDNMKGWYTGYGATPQQALQAAKNEVYKNYTPGYELKFVVTETKTNRLNELEEKIGKVLALRKAGLVPDSTKFDIEWAQGYNECLAKIQGILR